MTADPLRDRIRAHLTAPEGEVLDRLLAHAPSPGVREAAEMRATGLVETIRADGNPGLMEVFLAEYGLSTREGIALMCLAEALLRVPDADTIDALIEDKIAPSDWGVHLGRSSSSLVNASTWALLLTGKVLQDGEGMASVLKGAVRRLGEPVIRTAVGRAMKEMGRQFVLGETIDEALNRGRAKAALGYTFSYDMLGEAALTAHDAEAFRRAYADAIARLARTCAATDIRENPGISIKLSALHPRYEAAQRARVMDELVPRVAELARQAAAAGMGLNIDAEEADRLDLSLDVIEAVLSDPALAGWEGFGIVVQAYGKRCLPVIDWLHALASRLDRRIMVRLVKGAYWDSEVKRAQVDGLADFPVFTRKVATDVSYLCCARRLLDLSDRIYPQLATHNAHSVATILEMAPDPKAFEFQRLHGMGEVLHDHVIKANGTRCRIYAPVGAHRDLLAYLVRRLLENGANSSFVNQIVDVAVPPSRVAADPFAALAAAGPNRAVVAPADLFAPERRNSRGVDLRDPVALAAVETARRPWRTHVWEAGPVTVSGASGGDPVEVRNPADPADLVGRVREATAQEAALALAAARPWDDAMPAERAHVLRRASDLYEAAEGELFAVLAREAGKTLPDAVSELREAVDFLRYYAAGSERLTDPARGRITCISPWNFPLAIFTGQVAAALATGNGVLAKPAEATSLTAAIAVRLLHEAGVPRHALQLLPGRGGVVGTTLTSDALVDGVCFTGSTATAQRINRAMAEHVAPTAPLVAETGGLNAMIVDSTALPEQAVRDIVLSAFRSAGQRCSALRMLYLQEDIAQPFLKMLYGAMDELTLGDPWELRTDIGPVISAGAQAGIEAHIAAAEREDLILKRLPAPGPGHFVAPVAIRLPGIEALDREVFGPVLHVATFRAEDLDRVVDAINAKGYGLTFALHSRIDDRVEQVAARVAAGNIYINRNQIGAVVGSQPFGGEGLSGTGPKAGGPAYLHRFVRPRAAAGNAEAAAPVAGADVQRALDRLAGQGRWVTARENLPGPTGESNRLTTLGRGVVLCLGPGADRARAQADAVRAAGAEPLAIAPRLAPDEGLSGTLAPEALRTLTGFDAVVFEGRDEDLRPMRAALSARDGALLPLLAEADFARWVVIERHLCIDTTASGGNAALLASAG
jgi:RHH-type proline utilization regulon transcriptional repressor/proline dehydrogenase/delta 1-pyrroline-5-carboxylate dehydrogenase